MPSRSGEEQPRAAWDGAPRRGDAERWASRRVPLAKNFALDSGRAARRARRARKEKKGPRAALGALLVLASGACSPSPPETVLPYPIGQAMVFGAPEGGVALQVNASCESDVCLAVLERCGAGAYAEVVLGSSREVLDVLCYRGDLRARELRTTPFEAIGSESETVFVIDALDDGADLLGELVISGDHDVLYGAGPEVSVLAEGLRIEGESTIVRAITIRGDVTINENDAKLSLVQINGDLIINGNDATVSESVVHGNVSVVGSRAVLARNLFEGAARLSATNLRCHLNQRFDDEDRDRVIEPSELGGEVACQ